MPAACLASAAYTAQQAAQATEEPRQGPPGCWPWKGEVAPGTQGHGGVGTSG